MQTLLLFVACFLVPVFAQSANYTVGTYPDPIDRYQACGRARPSFICDPQGYLSESEADAIDNLVKNIYNETTVPCYSSGPRATRRKGYLVMVAIVPKMTRYFTVNVTDYNRATQFREAQLFSYYLGQGIKWGKHSSSCNETVIVLYSVEDNVLYTSTQSKAREKLVDTRVRDTIMNAYTMYYPFDTDAKKASVLNYLVRTYGESLREDTTV